MKCSTCILGCAIACGFFALSACSHNKSNGSTSVKNRGYVTSRAWSAWPNEMPGPGSKSLHVKGEVDVATACYAAELKPHSGPSTPESLHLDLVITKPYSTCADAIKTIPVTWMQQPYNGGKTQVVIHLPDGKTETLAVGTAH
jgi:hypothetical protein